MKEVKEIRGLSKTFKQEFDGINEFYNYICETPLNEVFRWAEHSSVTGTYRFTQTDNFDEATNLLKHGWSDMAKQLDVKLKLIANQVEPSTKARANFDVVGFQASVPRYLQGIPTSMVNKKQVPVKQKVITLNKDISYAARVTKEEIVESSTKALQIIKKLEAQGYRVNLNIIWGDAEGNEKILTKVRIKNASERLNISKVAFPLVHPSMLRRLFFRYLEIHPDIKDKRWIGGYGCPMQNDELLKHTKGEYLLPRIITDVDIEIKNIMQQM